MQCSAMQAWLELDDASTHQRKIVFEMIRSACSVRSPADTTRQPCVFAKVAQGKSSASADMMTIPPPWIQYLHAVTSPVVSASTSA